MSDTNPPTDVFSLKAENKRVLQGSTGGRAERKHNPIDKAKAAYDVVVIGSGLAGMTGANVLAKQGRKVLLVEQHYNFGGMATWFKRSGGHIFDISLHGFPVGMKKTCKKYWNDDIANSIVQLDSIKFDNPQFSFETSFNREDYSNKLVSVFGLSRELVEKFFTYLRGLDFYNDTGETCGQLFERFFPGRNDVHRLLMEPITYANGSTLAEPAVAYGIVFSNFMSKGVFTFSGGTDQLILKMRKELQKNGVDMFSGVNVDKILVKGGRVAGVCANGRDIAAPAVLSNANVKATILNMVGPEHFKPGFVEQTRAVRLSNSSCQVYMGVRQGESIPFVTDLLFCSEAKSFTSEELCDMRTLSRTFSFYYPKTRPDISPRYTIVSSTNAHYADWKSLNEHEYAAAKGELAERTIEHLEKYLPDIRDKLDHVEVSTPRTFEFYTQQQMGASFGTKWEGLKVSMELDQQLPGLFHAGSVGIIMSGWLGAANYGVIAANKVDAYVGAAK
ncbi:MAG: NAD(P)/FAD-dependent oxidoreductase [Planctomycetes bacterium]|nr:NAD(P)/FAD-dependent oxidoreductase [Planctomycetota bacterium]